MKKTGRINLTLEEYEKIIKLRNEGLGSAEIGRQLNRSKTTIHRRIHSDCMPHYLMPKPLKLPGHKLIECYLAEIGSTSLKTKKTYLDSVKLVDNYCQQTNLKLSDLKREDLVNILNTTKSKNFRFQVLKHIKVIFSWAYRVQYLPANPAETIKIKKPAAKVKPTIISLPDIKQILEAAKDPVTKLIIQLLLYTGLRLHEVLALKLSNIDLPSRTIKIERAKMDKVFLKIIPENLADAITNYLSVNAVHSQYLISYPNGKPYTPGGIGKQLQNLVKSTCPDKRITSHMFRHTYASLAARSIQSTIIGRQALSESMGWSSDKMFNTYMHVGQDQIEIKEMIKKMEETWLVLQEVP